MRNCLGAVTALCVGLWGAAAFAADARLPVVDMVTDLGRIVIEIDVNHAPKSAGGFLAYVDRHAYDGGAFFRAVRPDNDASAHPIQVIQAGIGDRASPVSPGVEHESTAVTGLRHLDGTVSLARAGVGTATGATFFVCVGEQPALDFGGARNADGQGFAAFGRVIEGMEVVRAIHRAATDAALGQGAMQGQMISVPVGIREARRR